MSYRIEIKASNNPRFASLQEAQRAAGLASLPALLELLNFRLQTGVYKIVDGRIVKCDNKAEEPNR